MPRNAVGPLCGLVATVVSKPWKNGMHWSSWWTLSLLFGHSPPGKHLQENALTLAVVVVKEKAHHGDLGRLLSEPVFEGLRGCGLVLGDFERA